MRKTLSPRQFVVYGALFLFLAGLGAWLINDFLQERNRSLDEAAQLAVQKSQIMSRALADTFSSADYVLRDVLGHVDVVKDLAHSGKGNEPRLDGLLKEKVASVSGLTDLVLLDSNCTFIAVARHPLHGTRSHQRFCSEPKIAAGQSLHLQYMPSEQSASHRPVILMSRTVASADGRLLGAAMAVIDLEYAQNWISMFATNPQDVLAIVDGDATLIARNPPLPAAMGKRAQPVPGQPPFNEMGSGQSSFFTAVSPLDGRERVFGLSRLERFPFIAIVGFDKARVLQGWRHRAWQFSFGFLGLLVLSLVALHDHMTAVRQREEMRRLAITDMLTGIANRRHLMEIGQREVDRAARHGRPFSVLMLDIDRFKSINDTWGHPTGDAVICKLADTLVASARSPDVAGRLGGEEFAIVLPETDMAGAHVIAQRLRTKVEALHVKVADGDATLRFTVSIGVASIAEERESFDVLLRRADQALYRAKDKGRNRVET